MVYLMIAFVLTLGNAIAQDADCMYAQNVRPGELYYINNPNYPSAYPPNKKCTYMMYCSPGYNCRIDCRLSMPSSTGCSGDRLLVSRSGDPTLVGATAYCGVTSFTAVSVAQQMSVEQLKRRKYANLGSGYIFEPFGVETLGPWGPGAHIIFQNLSERLVDATRNQNAGIYLAQRISITIQRGNAASMLGTLPTGFLSLSNSRGGFFVCNVTTQPIPTTTPPPSTLCSCGLRKTNRIVGGTETREHEYTMIAAIIEISVDLLHCGGTIISSRYILTAAHCIAPYRNRPDQLQVSVGDHNINKRDPKNQYGIERFIIHENYNPSHCQNWTKFIWDYTGSTSFHIKKNHHNPYTQSRVMRNTFDYDVALVRLIRDIIFDGDKQPVCLPFQFTSTDFTGRNVTFIGWGTTTPGGMLPDRLREVDVTVYNQQQCARTQNVTPRQFCTLTVGKDACQFDSGGPALYDDRRTGRLFQKGIISSGNGCGSPNPSINTDVASTPILRWIVNNANANFCMIRN